MENDNPFSPTSGAGSAPELIPANTLAWAILKVASKKNTKESGGEYYNLELTVVGGPYEGRKAFEMIANYQDMRNGEKWRQMAITALSRIMESSGFWKQSDPESYKSFVGKPFEHVANFIDGQRVAIKIKIEKNSDPAYADKNKVAEWLSPNPGSRGGYRDYMTLVGGTAGAPEVRPQTFSAPTPTAAPGWVKTPSSSNPF